jgi:hypothetical protein
LAIHERDPGVAALVVADEDAPAPLVVSIRDNQTDDVIR